MSEDDHDEEMKSHDGDVISWERKWIEKDAKEVRFAETVRVRPITAVGRQRSCRGARRSQLRGSWPNSRGSSLGKDISLIGEGAIKMVIDEGSIVKGNEDELNRHEVQRKVHECKVKKLHEVQVASGGRGSRGHDLR